MSAVTVVGVASLTVSIGVDRFPVDHRGSREPRWIDVALGSVASHQARVLHDLGDDVRLCSPVGRDPAGRLVRDELARCGLDGPGVVDCPESSLGATLVAPDGARMALPHLRPVDGFAYPFDLLRERARGADLLVLTNARFVRPLVPAASALGVPVAVDVHRVDGFGDEYDRPWLERAAIVFGSHERMGDPRAWIAGMFARHPRLRVAGVGRGPRGALAGTRDGRLVSVRAVTPRPVVSTSGAGDALFATFLHAFLRTGDPVPALRTAVVHAGWKIGSRRPSAESLAPAALARLVAATEPATEVGRWDR